MHFLTVVVVPAGTQREEAEAAISPLLAPYNENTVDDGWWDWYQVGGRFTGIYAEYDPSQDDRNNEVCRLCLGTGARPDMLVANGCNGCRGTGVAQKWPTQWVSFDGDVVPVKVLLNNPGVPVPCNVVTPAGAFESERWDGSSWVKDEDWQTTLRVALEPFEGDALVVVDCHS